VSTETQVPTGFGDRLAAAVSRRESQVVLGLDPDPARLWPARSGSDPGDLDRALGVAVRMAAGHLRVDASRLLASVRAADAVLVHCRAVIDAVGAACVAVKPQSACFERMGGPGWLALEAVCAHARTAGLLVLADVKRGDVPVTAVAYGEAMLSGMSSPFGELGGLAADAMTANPLLGGDAMTPLVRTARAGAQGVFALVRTSNQGAADIMDVRLQDGDLLWERIARMVCELGGPGRGGRSGMSDVGAVTGATAPEHLARMRELMPHTPFLLPGVGSQGGDVASLGPAFAPGRAAGLVTASRSIVNAHEHTGTTAPHAARTEAERLRGAAWALV
jgi:orotidine-5'-phosphate decarboxylase